MKKVFFGLVISAFAFASCGGSSDGPKEALQKNLDAMEQGDFMTVVEGMNLANDPSKEQKEQLAAVFAEKAGKNKDTYKITGDSIIVEDSLAVVFFDITSENGSVKSEQQKMVKKDGKWLMEVGK